jgi:acyl carrier protein
MDDVSVRRSGSVNQQYLLQLWGTQLNNPNLGISDDYFAAGGSSMQIIEMLVTVSERFCREIDFAEFFKEPCVRRLSELIES